MVRWFLIKLLVLPTSNPNLLTLFLHTRAGHDGVHFCVGRRGRRRLGLEEIGFPFFGWGVEDIKTDGLLGEVDLSGKLRSRGRLQRLVLAVRTMHVMRAKM